MAESNNSFRFITLDQKTSLLRYADRHCTKEKKNMSLTFERSTDQGYGNCQGQEENMKTYLEATICVAKISSRYKLIMHNYVTSQDAMTFHIKSFLWTNSWSQQLCLCLQCQNY